MRLAAGMNFVDGVPVVVSRKSIRRINLRVAQDGTVCLSVPMRWATLAEGEAFLRANWSWAVAMRARVMAQPVKAQRPVADEEIAFLEIALGDLHSSWCERLGEPGVTWGIRRMKSLWGSCHFTKRHVVYSASLARVPRDLVEYVVVHELTHLKVHNHGRAFQALMDARLPGWRTLRHRLSRGG